MRHAVFHCADGAALALPLLDQRRDVLALQPDRPQALEAEIVQGVGEPLHLAAVGVLDVGVEVRVVGRRGGEPYVQLVLAFLQLAQPVHHSPDIRFRPGDIHDGELWGPMREETASWFQRIYSGNGRPMRRPPKGIVI